MIRRDAKPVCAILLQPWMLLSHGSPEVVNLNPLLRVFDAGIQFVHVGLDFSHPLLEHIRVIGIEPEWRMASASI